MTDLPPTNPFAAEPTSTGTRENDPLAPSAPPEQTAPVDPEYQAWRDQRDADRAAAPGHPEDGEPGCPACGASLTNPAFHEKLGYCWRCGFGAGAGQDYPKPEQVK